LETENSGLKHALAGVNREKRQLLMHKVKGGEEKL
jgi:hypothetical protein